MYIQIYIYVYRIDTFSSKVYNRKTNKNCKQRAFSLAGPLSLLRFGSHTLRVSQKDSLSLSLPLSTLTLPP